MTTVEEKTEIDLDKLKWRRPLHQHELMIPVTTVPWKALCGAILYDKLEPEPGDEVCPICRQIYFETVLGNS